MAPCVLTLVFVLILVLWTLIRSRLSELLTSYDQHLIHQAHRHSGHLPALPLQEMRLLRDFDYFGCRVSSFVTYHPGDFTYILLCRISFASPYLLACRSKCNTLTVGYFRGDKQGESADFDMCCRSIMNLGYCV